MAGSVEAAERAAEQDVPAGRLGTVEEYAAVTTFLCSESASYVTGTSIPVDGGLMRSL
jgi:3-oxoacyl-[acyl-carrier protein] reductase